MVIMSGGVDDVIACLTRLTGKVNKGYMHREVIRLIGINFQLNEISVLMRLSPKTACGYIDQLKNHFHQPRLSKLYCFIKKLSGHY